MRLSDITKESRKIVITFETGKLEVEYRHNAYTPETESIVSDTERPGRALAQLLSKVLIRWDLLDDSGNPYPTDLDSLMKLPVAFMLKVFEGIANDMKPNPQTTGG